MPTRDKSAVVYIALTSATEIRVPKVLIVNNCVGIISYVFTQKMINTNLKLQEH